MQRFHASCALLPERWRAEVGGEVDARAAVAAETPGADPSGAVPLAGPVVPNRRSHAFQRTMVGITETVDEDRDGFWSWRETMYRFVSRLDPDAPGLAGRGGNVLLDGWLFAPGPSPVRDVFVGGRHVVQNGRHALQDAALDGFRRTTHRALEA